MIGVRAIMDVSSLRSTLQRQGRDLGPVLVRFMQRIAVLVEQNSTKRLAGSGAPGAYPVPIRTGFLRRSMGSESDATSATVFNTAEYAGAIHAGYRPYGNPKANAIAARPFLADGTEETDIQGELNDALLKVFS